MKGKISSFQSLGTLDGPGIRFVVFMQGCNLRCGCCHNPETWDVTKGKEYTSEEILKKVIRYKEYFLDNGGITISGGEPLLQPQFIKEIFELCQNEGINTCLDTSGCLINDEIKKMLEYTDRVLLDIKYTNAEMYKNYVGCEYINVLEFLNYLNKKQIKTTLRQVIIPSLNDNRENIENLNKLKNKYQCIDKIELLPFKKLCQSKYDNLNLLFSFRDYNEPSQKEIDNLNGYLK